MDTITHGIAGALIAKAIFGGEDLFRWRGGATQGQKNGSEDAPQERSTGLKTHHYVTRGRVITWALMLGAVFPDSDVFRDLFSHDKLLIVTWHRSITHSLVLMPLWALLLAALTHWFAKRKKWESATLAELTGIYAVGIVSHILLDLVTTFGTMIWSPLEWSRPAWDLIFIIDFTLSAILLVPQLLAWVYSQPEKIRRRAVGMWLVFMPAPFVIARVAQAAGAPISERTVLATIVVLAGVILVPVLRGWGLRIRYATWSRAGFAGALVYVAVAFYAHRTALERIHKFAELDHLQVEAIGALPLPPSVWRWEGLVRGPRGVYELRMDLSDKAGGDSELLAQEHRYFPDAPPNSYIEAARHLPEVQKVLWFARFPVTRFHKEGEEAVVEISDLRFARMLSSRPAAFTYQVRFGADGNVLSQGWATR